MRLVANIDPIAPPELGRWSAEAYVLEHLGHLIDRRAVDLPDSSSEFRGGQASAEAALAAFDVAGYAARKDEAYPLPRRSVSQLSPFVRHGLLSLDRLWDHVEGGPDEDVRAFRGELLWQEYARHRYARTRVSTAKADTAETSGDTAASESTKPYDPASQRSSTGRGWDRRMGCVEIALDELEEDGWLVNQARRWLASHWVGAEREEPAEGEDYFFRHLLDGSRAANGLGWAGAGGYVFTRWDVEERAAGLCASCDLVSSCPIERPREEAVERALETAATTAVPPELRSDIDPIATAGPHIPVFTADGRSPEAVWITAESMGDADPALTAHPDLPVVFVFDEPLLARLRLSSKRLTFMVETIAELAARRTVEVYLGEPTAVLAETPLAVTFTPVPGWRRRAEQLDTVAVHPWPWLRQPHGDDASTFDIWRGGLA